MASSLWRTQSDGPRPQENDHVCFTAATVILLLSSNSPLLAAWDEFEFT
jgi:hypothetical protein